MINKLKDISSMHVINFCGLVVFVIIIISAFYLSKDGVAEDTDTKDKMVLSPKLIIDSIPNGLETEFNNHRYAGECFYNNANDFNEEYSYAYQEYQLALDEFSAANKIYAKDYNVNYKTAMCYFEMAKINKTKGDLDMQKENLELADQFFDLAYSTRSDDPVMLHLWADTLFQIANMNSDDYKKGEILKDSLDKTEKSIKIKNDQEPVRMLQIEVLYEIASIEYNHGNKEAAFVYYSTLIDQSQDLKNVMNRADQVFRVNLRVAYSYQCSAQIKYESQQFGEAADYYNNAINIMTECALTDNNYLKNVAELRYALAGIRLEQDQIDDALNQCQMAISNYERLSTSRRLSCGETINLGDNHYRIAQILFWRIEDRLSAYDHYQKASEKYEGFVSRRKTQIECLKQMEKIMEEVGDKETMIKVMKKRTKLMEVS